MARLPRGVKDKDHELAVEVRERVPTIIDTIDPQELVNAIKRAPSLRGMILGYISEEMYEKHVLNAMCQADEIEKPDCHDRTMNKADRYFPWNGRRYSVQLKSIQTNSVAWRHDINCLTADVQNDGSDRRTVELPNGLRIETTNYKVGDYDILAVPLFPFTGDWRFAYKRNRDCRSCESSKYTEEARRYLLSSTEQITWPLTGDWTEDLTSLLDETLGEPL